MTTVLAGCHRGELFAGLTPGDVPFLCLACEQTRLLFTIIPKWRASSHAFPCLVLCIYSVRASSPVWANKTSRARTRERAANTPRAPAFASPVACLSRVYFLLYPQMESLLAGYCLYRYSLAISLSWVMFSVTVTLKGPHVRVSGSFYSLKHSTVSISC